MKRTYINLSHLYSIVERKPFLPSALRNEVCLSESLERGHILVILYGRVWDICVGELGRPPTWYPDYVRPVRLAADAEEDAVW